MFFIRKIEQKDKEITFLWANDADTRANSLNTNSISFAEHSEWFDRSLGAATAKLFIVEDGDQNSVSLVRFEQKTDGNWYVGIVVSPNFRGKGVGTQSLSLGLDEINSENIEQVYAQIKAKNVVSISIFEKHGFELIGGTDVLLYRKRIF